VVQLHHHTDQLDALDAHTLLISFSKSAGYGKRWLSQLGVSWPLILDPDKELYQRYGLRHSVTGAWSLRTLWFYAKRILQGKDLHGIQGDPNQLGGDFIIDAEGMVQWAYRSTESVDRPEVDALLDVLANM
jgi:alkyl hydroperoxide reductase subunit AhpC